MYVSLENCRLQTNQNHYKETYQLITFFQVQSKVDLYHDFNIKRKLQIEIEIEGRYNLF